MKKHTVTIIGIFTAILLLAQLVLPGSVSEATTACPAGMVR